MSDFMNSEFCEWEFKKWYNLNGETIINDYESDCGRRAVFWDSSPKEDLWKYCPYCKRKIKETE